MPISSFSFNRIGRAARLHAPAWRRTAASRQELPGPLCRSICFGHQLGLKRFERAPMTDDQDEGEGKAAAPGDPRRERLKQALRENLKRRKSQVRQRGRQTNSPSTCHETVLDDRSGDAEE
jgi:hypothetical protein